MTLIPEPDWTLIRAAYEAGVETVEQISRRFDVPMRSIFLHRQIENWPKRSLTRRPGGVPRFADAFEPDEGDAPPVRKRSGPANAVLRRRMIKRLCNAIDIKLSQLERGMQSDTPESPADSERQARAVATLIRGLDKMTELNAEPAQSAGGAKAAGAGNGADGADATPASGRADDPDNRFRRQLAERIARYRRARRLQRGE